MTPLKIGILGCADIARRLVIPNMKSLDVFQVVTVASRTSAKAEEFGKIFACTPVTGYQDLLDLETIDAVYIPLPTGLHYEWITKALKAGKHVFAEKSIATNAEETKTIIELAKEKQLCVFENFMFPYHSQFEFVLNKIKEGAIGELRCLRSSFGFQPFSVDTNIRYKKELGGGALLDAGAYTLMAAQLFLGQNLKVVGSELFNFGKEVDFSGAALLSDDKGITAQLAFGFDNYYQNNIELWGSKGKLIVDRAFTAGPGFMPKIIIEQQNKKEEFTLPADNHFKKILIDFHAKISDKEFDAKFDQILSQSNLISKIQINGQK